MAEFTFATEITVRFAETDAQGIAHHANYFVWLEVARIAYLERFARGYRELQAQGIEATTLEVYLRYVRPARFDDRLVVRARCVDVRGARFRFEYAIERDGTAVADGWTAHACVDATTLRPTRVPEWLVEALEAAEALSGEPPGSPEPRPQVR